jgi:hypothetical protein
VPAIPVKLSRLLSIPRLQRGQTGPCELDAFLTFAGRPARPLNQRSRRQAACTACIRNHAKPLACPRMAAFCCVMRSPSRGTKWQQPPQSPSHEVLIVIFEPWAAKSELKGKGVVAGSKTEARDARPQRAAMRERRFATPNMNITPNINSVAEDGSGTTLTVTPK